MRIVFLLFCMAFSLLVSGQDTLRVLFLGNSYTAANNLPQLVHDVARSAGDSLAFSSNTPGGYTFEAHSTNTTTLSLIAQGAWTHVVLQEQSQRPSFTDAEVESDVFPYARMLDSLILKADSCTETVFYMTWGRKNGDASNCAIWPPVCTYNGMDSLLHLRYMMMADSNNAIVSPVGAVWHYLRDHQPGIELYSADESHPSEAGSYAAACAFYTVLFRKNPALITYDYSLSTGDASIIRDAVKVVVFDSLLNWHVGEYDPVAAFTAQTQPGNAVLLQNHSTGASTYEWDFGDGFQSHEIAPQHTYAAAGMYAIRLVASYCGISDTLIQWVSVSITSVDESENTCTIFPNPATDVVSVQLSSPAPAIITIIDLSGRTLLSTQFQGRATCMIDVTILQQGLYTLSIRQGEQLIRKSLMISK